MTTRAPKRWLGLGCMRLSTAPERDDAAAVALLHAAFDAGIDLLDTADAYCRDESDVGHNERLIARALASWSGDRSRVRVATKGGLTRPQGRWVPDGRARQLRQACAASRAALGVEQVFLYQLHAPDPRVPLATSVRALAALRRDGLVERVGLSNVSLRQLEEALRIARIDAVQVELSVLHDASLWNGVVGRCTAEGIPLVAHRPLGGSAGRRRLERDPVLVELGARHGATPAEVALAWLWDLAPVVVPIPGATRVLTLLSGVRAAGLALDDEDRARLDARFPAGRSLRGGTARVPAAAPRAEAGEVVLVMGLPASGKSTLAEALVKDGHARLNRDARGGRLAGLVPALDELLASGRTRVVLDNTYATRKSRAAVVEAASARGVPVRCVWLDTRIEDAQVNAVRRILERYGRLLEPDEMRQASRFDPGTFGPSVLFRYQRDLEPPDAGEGFSKIEVVPFRRSRDESFTRRAVVVWLDDVVWRSRSGSRTPLAPDDVELIAGRAEVLRRHAASGLPLFGLTWQPDVESGRVSRTTLAACVAVLRQKLGLALEVSFCPHAAGPPACWCRKPLPGLGVELILKHRLDPALCLYVGGSALDRGFAARLGFDYRDQSAFFAPDFVP
ncbi:MAG TPA: aldo/keto reductase [Vicinamibacteria bacterium]